MRCFQGRDPIPCGSGGGGNLVVPAGHYCIDGPIHLQNNIHIRIQEGARIFFSDDPQSYLPVVKVRWEGTVCYNFSPLIYGYRLENVAITGEGVIDGNGVEWSKEWREKQDDDKARLRQMGNDLVSEEERVFGSGFHDQNGDGKDDGHDPDSSEDVLIEGCEIKTHDDGVSVKAGRDQDAWDRQGNRNIIVRNNNLLSGVNAICIGSSL